MGLGGLSSTQIILLLASFAIVIFAVWGLVYMIRELFRGPDPECRYQPGAGDALVESTGRLKWMAAIPYLLALLVIVNGDILGNYDLNLLGVRLSLITLIPFLIYHFVNRDHTNTFIASHTKRAMRIFLRYFLVTILLQIALAIMGLGILTLDPMMFLTSSSLGLLLAQRCPG